MESEQIAIQAAIQAYAHAIDAMDWTSLAEVFTPDATVKYHNYDVVSGNANIAEFLRERVGATTWHQHFISTTKVSVETSTQVGTETGSANGGGVGSGVAEATSAFIAHSISAARPGKIRMTLGSYYDKVVLTPYGWKIAHRDQVTGIREVRDLGDPNG